MSRNTHINRRIWSHPLRKALAITACAAGGLIGLGAVPAAQAAAGAAAAVPPNQAPRSAVALAFDPVGAGFAFYRGADNAVYLRTFSGTGPAWSAQSRIGGVIIGAPAAAAAGTTVVVAARGTDDALWLRMMHNGTWGSWISWGGVLTSSPAISGTADGRIDVFGRGTDNAVWTRSLAFGGALAPWRSWGGRVTTAPAVENGTRFVAAAGTDHAVWVSSGSGWTSLGGRTYSAPANESIPQTNGGFVYVRGTDNALYAMILGGGGHGPWQKIGGTLTDAPTAVGTSEPTPREIVGVIGTDHALWTTHGGWSNAFTRAWVPVG